MSGLIWIICAVVFAVFFTASFLFTLFAARRGGGKRSKNRDDNGKKI